MERERRWVGVCVRLKKTVEWSGAVGGVLPVVCVASLRTATRPKRKTLEPFAGGRGVGVWGCGKRGEGTPPPVRVESAPSAIFPPPPPTTPSWPCSCLPTPALRLAFWSGITPRRRTMARVGGAGHSPLSLSPGARARPWPSPCFCESEKAGSDCFFFTQAQCKGGMQGHAPHSLTPRPARASAALPFHQPRRRGPVLAHSRAPARTGAGGCGRIAGNPRRARRLHRSCGRSRSPTS